TGVPAADVVDMVRAHPDLAHAFATLHQRHRNSADLLAALTEDRNALDEDVDRNALAMPHEEVRDYYYRRQNYTDSLDRAAEDLYQHALTTPHEEVPDDFYRRQTYIVSLDRAAEDLTTRIRMNRGDVGTALEIRLAETHGVQIGRRVDLPDGLWHRFSPTERRLELSAHLTTGQQAFRVASELAFLEHGGLLDELVRSEEHTSELQSRFDLVCRL